MCYWCGSLETANHLFFSLLIFGSVWNYILQWVGLNMALPFVASDHFNQFGFGGGGTRVRQSFLNGIWFAIVWEIWKERNNFQEYKLLDLVLLDIIKLLSYSWLKEKFVQFSLNYHGWWLGPLPIRALASCCFFLFFGFLFLLLAFSFL